MYTKIKELDIVTFNTKVHELEAMMKIFLFIFIFSLSFNAYAYIDPGIGSLLLQSIVAGFAITIGTISLYWDKCKNLISTILKKLKKKSDINDI